MKKYSIYTLSVEEGGIFYVGVTTSPLAVRLTNHLTCSKTHPNPVYEFIRKCDSDPIISLVEEIYTDDKMQAFSLEAFWVEQFRQWGFKLYNSAVVAGKRMKNNSEYKLPMEATKIYTDIYIRMKQYLSNKKPKMTISSFLSTEMEDVMDRIEAKKKPS